MTSTMNPGFNPYTFVRTNVMRSKLLKKEDYHKLLKMSVAEITKYLQDREYRDDINRLGVAQTGIDLLDHALSDNLERTFVKLRRICDDELRELVDAYLMRHEVWNVKTVLRAVYTDADKQEAKKLLLITGSGLGEDFYTRMLKETSLAKALEMLKTTPFAAVAGANNLIDAENQLDAWYNASLIDMAEHLVRDGALYRRFLMTEVEIQNILTVIRLKVHGMSKEEIRPHLVDIPISRLNRWFEKILDAHNVEGVVELSRKTAFFESMEKGLAEYKKTKSLLEMERQLRKYMLRISERLLHQNLLSFNTILGFMLAKEYEVKNLRTLLKGKALGIDNVFIEEELLVV